MQASRPSVDTSGHQQETGHGQGAVAREEVGSGGLRAFHPGATALGPAFLLALQRSVGNRAVNQLVVQRDKAGRAPPPPSPLPDATQAATKPFGGMHDRMVDNPVISREVYKTRIDMLRRFVAWHRELEIKQLTSDDAKAAAIQHAHDLIQAERDRLEGLEAKSKADVAAIKAIDSKLRLLEGKTENALKVAEGWANEHGADDVKDADLEAEVKRLGTALALPDWEITTIVDYGGMRYGRDKKESGGAPTAHGSYYSPQRLLWAIEYVRLGKAEMAKHKDEPTQLMNLTEEEALGRLQDMDAAGKIPPRVWRLIVYRTDLRKDTKDADWNDINVHAPKPGSEEAKKEAEAEKSKTPEQRELESEWQQVMKLWTSESRVPGARGGASDVVGMTGWRAEMYRRKGVVALGVVCNELAEAIANQRGINLTGGITANALDFSTDKGPAGMGTAAQGRYFGRVDDEHLMPGANLFFTHDNWQKEGHPWDNVIAVSGVTYPQRLDPGADGHAPNDPMPSGIDSEGWCYSAEPGRPVHRTRQLPAGVAGPWEMQYMTWSHEATVAELHGDQVMTLETTGIGAGISSRSRAWLKASAGIYLGVDAQAHPTPAPASPTTGDPGGAGTRTEPTPAHAPGQADEQQAIDAGRKAGTGSPAP